jgi:hypothetical protein
VATRKPCIAVPVRQDYFRAINWGVFGNAASAAVNSDDLLRVQCLLLSKQQQADSLEM